MKIEQVGSQRMFGTIDLDRHLLKFAGAVDPPEGGVWEYVRLIIPNQM